MTILKQAPGTVGTAEKTASLCFKKPNISEQAKESQSSESESGSGSPGSESECTTESDTDDEVTSTGSQSSHSEGGSSGSESECTTESETDDETASVEPGNDNQSVSPTRAGNIVTAAPQVATSRVTQVNTQREDVAKKPRKENPWTICLSHCRYEIVRSVARRYGLHEVDENEQWNIYWTDYSVTIERAMDMRRFQLINHFPGMNEICRKDLLARNLNRMKKLFGKDFDIYPKTWNLPGDLAELQNYAMSRRNKIYICKPEMGSQGRGIFLIKNIKDLNPFGRIVCQLYLAKPFLIDNYKFDLRLYVLITSCDPFRVYLYKEGLARFATARYKPPTNKNNTENSYMHLTNYAVNKFSRDYVVDEDCGSKRKLTSVWKWLREHGYNVDALCEEIDDVIIKTIISAGPTLKQNYNSLFRGRFGTSACFEILGFDIILDHKLKPYILEVNHSPSFHTDTPLDLEIKEGLLNDAFAMLNIKRLNRRKVQAEERKRVQQRLTKTVKKESQAPNNEKPSRKLTNPMDVQFAYEVAHSGGYRMIYPSLDSEKYDPYFEQTLSIFQETAASQARAKCTRSHIEEYNYKKLIDEQKRVANSRDTALGKEKLLLPESSCPSATGSPAKRKARLVKPIAASFLPTTIKPEEELERMKSNISRGILVRSLGIEAQAFQLLCHNGNIKPEEEMVYTQTYGSSKPVVKSVDEPIRVASDLQNRGDSSVMRGQSRGRIGVKYYAFTDI